jgi:hypothetical protein
VTIPAGLALLRGVWEGRGTLTGERAFTSRMEATELLSRFLQVDIVCHAGGELIHEERVLYFERPDGLAAASFAANGKVMHWRAEAAPDRIVLTRAPHDGDGRTWRWTIEARGADALHEEFLCGPSPGALSALVVLDHSRVSDPA